MFPFPSVKIHLEVYQRLDLVFEKRIFTVCILPSPAFVGKVNYYRLAADASERADGALSWHCRGMRPTFKGLKAATCE